MDRNKGYVIRLRGLPYSASATDVLKFLDGIEVVRGLEGVVFTYTPDGRPTGEAFVELQTEDGQREAMKRHKELMGNRYIELFTSTKADLNQAIQHNRLILGYANRQRQWIGNPGMQPRVVYGPSQGRAVLSNQPAGQYARNARLDEMSDLFAGVLGSIFNTILVLLCYKLVMYHTMQACLSVGIRLLVLPGDLLVGLLDSLVRITMGVGREGTGLATSDSLGPGHSTWYDNLCMQPKQLRNAGLMHHMSCCVQMAGAGYRNTQTQQVQRFSVAVGQNGNQTMLVQQPYIIQQAGQVCSN